MSNKYKYPKKSYREWLKRNYPLYVKMHDWLTDVLYAMQHNIADPIDIEIDDPQEPTVISIVLYPKYTD